MKRRLKRDPRPHAGRAPAVPDSATATGVDTGRAPDGRVLVRGSHVITLVALVALLVGAEPACSRRPEAALQGEGIVLQRVPRASSALPVVQRRPGDWQLTSEAIQVVISDEGSGGAAAGAIVDLRASDQAERDDELLEQVPALRSGDLEIPLRLKSVSSQLRNGRPVLRLERRSGDEALAVWTEIGLRANRAQVELVHRVYNHGRRPFLKLRFGDRSRFAVASIFVPQVGFLDRPMQEQAPWISWVGRLRTYTLLRPKGNGQVIARFEPHGQLDQTFLGERFDLAVGAYHEDRRQVMVTRGGLGPAAEAAWAASGVPHGWIRGRVIGAGSAATVAADDPEGRSVLVVTAAADGRFDLPVPAGDYRVSVRTPGGEDVHRVSVEAGRASEILEVVAPRPGFVRFEVRDGDSRPIAARLVVRGIAPTRDPELGPAHQAAGAGNVVYAADGVGEIALPEGRFEVIATHGPEYGIARQRLHLRRGEGKSVRFILEREVESIGWLGSEMHLHAEASPDSEVSLRDRVTSLLAEGVEVAVATDHNHVSSYAGAVIEMHAGNRLAAIAGIEVTTWAPLWGHFNVFPYPLEAGVPAVDGLAPDRFFPLLRAQAPGSVIQVNHPRMGSIGYFNRAELDLASGTGVDGYSPDFDTIEVWNGMDLGKPEVLERNLADWYQLLNLGRRYTATGNSDSHRLLYQWAGYPRTYLQIDDDRPEAVSGEQVARALRQGRAFVSSGPLLNVRVNGAAPGETAAAAQGRVRLQIAVRAASWIDVRQIQVIVNGRVALQHLVPAGVTRATRALIERELTLEGDGWIVAVVRGERTLDDVLPFSRGLSAAFSNPVYVDVDGDGQVRSPEPVASKDAASLDAATADR
jgi:hypothetical protein